MSGAVSGAPAGVTSLSADVLSYCGNGSIGRLRAMGIRLFWGPMMVMLLLGIRRSIRISVCPAQTAVSGQNGAFYMSAEAENFPKSASVIRVM